MASLTDEVVEGSFWAASSNFISTMGTFIFTIILARLLFPENFGLYTLTISVALVFMTFADLGLNQTFVRYFSSSLKNKSKAAAYFQYILKLKFLVSFIVSFALLIAAYPVSFWIYKKPELFLPLIMASLFILTTLFVYFFSSIFYAIKKIKYIGIRETAFQITRIIVTVAIIIFLTSTYHVFGIIVGLVLTNLFVIFLLFLWINKFAPYVLKKTKEKINKIQVIKFLGFATIATISGIFFAYVDTIMLGFFVSLTYVAYYRVAFSLVFGTKNLFTYIGSVLLPIFTNLERERTERAFNKVVRFILIFAIPATFGLLALGKYFIKLFYGHNYLPATIPLYFLSFMIITFIPTSIISVMFFSKEKPKHMALAILGAFILNIILNYILISSFLKISQLWAIAGAALATLISRWVLLFYSARISRKKLNIKLKKIIFLKPFIGGLIMFLILYYVNSFIVKDMTLIIGGGEVILGALIYFSVMFLIKGITKEDIEIIKKIPLIKKIKWKKDINQID